MSKHGGIIVTMDKISFAFRAACPCRWFEYLPACTHITEGCWGRLSFGITGFVACFCWFRVLRLLRLTVLVLQ